MRNLIKIVYGMMAILSFALSVFFISSNITGFAIAELSIVTNGLISLIFFFVGLIASWTYFRKKMSET